MEKNKKIILSVSIAVGVLVLGLILFTVYSITASPKEDPETTTEQTTQPDTDADTTVRPPVVTTVLETQPPSPQSSDAPQTTNADADGPFQSVKEQVTAKNQVNLRSSMDQGNDGNVVHCLVNGEVAQRTGIGSNGWSRVVYNGQTLYCVSSYLTTDLSYVPPVEETDLFKTKFAPVNEKVTAKEVTNLRDIPSVLEPSQVVVQLNHGDVAVRTGIANEGWSRVEYNGQVLYCISSYLELVGES